MLPAGGDPSSICARGRAAGTFGLVERADVRLDFRLIDEPARHPGACQTLLIWSNVMRLAAMRVKASENAGASLLSDGQAAEAVEPGMDPLDHPSMSAKLLAAPDAFPGMRRTIPRARHWRRRTVAS